MPVGEGTNLLNTTALVRFTLTAFMLHSRLHAPFEYHQQKSFPSITRYSTLALSQKPIGEFPLEDWDCGAIRMPRNDRGRDCFGVPLRL
jgi:hypothetical protein